MVSCEGMIHFAREALGIGTAVPIAHAPLAKRGSDRSFYRLTWNATETAVLIQYDPARAENAYYAEIAEFLRDIGVSVPRVIRHDPVDCLLLLEDMGNKDLWSFRDSPWEDRLTLYRKTLVIVRRLHSFSEDDFPSDRVRLMEGFGPELYRWEREYFMEHFVAGACAMELDPALRHGLETELVALADRLSGSGRCLVHRDLQSQNVMIRNKEPFLIDFQGMRFGSPFYDLGSLLSDPYVHFSDAEMEDLLFFYFGISDRPMDWDRFRDLFWDASAERLMQALGAYGFLGLKKGLTNFLEYIPGGLLSLHRAASHASSLPHLRKTAEACHAKWHSK